jgi:hypothetical protein
MSVAESRAKGGVGNTDAIFMAKKPSLLSKIPFKIIGIVLIVVVAVTGLSIGRHYYLKHQSEERQKQMISLLKQANSDFSPKELTKLGGVVAQIKSQPNYEQNPNYLYILVNYYINTDDVTDASTYYTKLEKVYSAKQGFSSYLSYDPRSMATMKSSISFLQNYNVKYLTAPNEP